MDRDMEAVYKNETGKDASYEEEDRHNCNRTNTVYYYDYINWLEDLANKSTPQTDQQANAAVGDNAKCVMCGSLLIKHIDVCIDCWQKSRR